MYSALCSSLEVGAMVWDSPIDGTRMCEGDYVFLCVYLAKAQTPIICKVLIIKSIAIHLK